MSHKPNAVPVLQEGTVYTIILDNGRKVHDVIYHACVACPIKMRWIMATDRAKDAPFTFAAESRKCAENSPMPPPA